MRRLSPLLCLLVLALPAACVQASPRQQSREAEPGATTLREAEPRTEADPLEEGKLLGVIPPGARPNRGLEEHDLAGFIGRLSHLVAMDNGLRLAHSVGPVSRMQAMTAIVKLLVANEDMTSFRLAGLAGTTPDTAQIPLWGRPYMAAALDQGWWDASAPFRPREAATWVFMQHVLARLPLRGEPRRRPAAAPAARTDRTDVPTARPEPPARQRIVPQVDELYTGLVVDARGFDLKRDHSPRVLDEDGAEVYPDAKHCPSPDYVEEFGMAAYEMTDEVSERSGKTPLIVRAIGTSGPGPFDVIVSNEDAQRILDANRRRKFLWRWKVALVIGAN